MLFAHQASLKVQKGYEKKEMIKRERDEGGLKNTRNINEREKDTLSNEASEEKRLTG